MMRTAITSLLLIALSSCSFVETSQDLEQVKITNATGETLWILAFHVDHTTTPVDPIPGFELGAVPFPQLHEGATLSLNTEDIPGYAPGVSVSLFVYAQREALQDDGAYEPYVAFVLFTEVPHDQLIRNNGHIVVSELAW